MLPRLLRLHPQTYHRLIRLSREAEREGVYRVAKRLQAVVLNSEGRTSGDLARILKAPRSKVSEWLARYQAHGVEGLLEGYRSRRPARLSEGQRPSWRHPRQRAGGLRAGQRRMDLAHDRLGHRRGVRRRLSSRACAQVAS
jgi:transposase